MRVYKFLSKQFALQNLTKQRIKISTYADMNDPFELLGIRFSNAWVHNQMIESAKTLTGALCFSRNWRNPMLWSHYADEHKGICMGLDIGPPEKIKEPIYG